MNRNLNRRIHPIAEADGLSPKKPRKDGVSFTIMAMTHGYGQGFIYEDDTSAKSNG